MGASSSAEYRPGLIVRPLRSTDIHEQYFTLLDGLYENICNFEEAETFVKNLNLYHQIIVIEDPVEKILVASGTVFIEPKIIHDFGLVGHIEDIVVHPHYQGHGVGSKLVEKLLQYGEDMGCYKCILDCSEDKIPFYEKCKFTKKDTQMSYYYATKNQVK